MKCNCGEMLNNETVAIRGEFKNHKRGKDIIGEIVELIVVCRTCGAEYFTYVPAAALILAD
jgi:hypothetical protein